jgi:hypothetical protein
VKPLTGTQLKSALVSDVPTGFKLDKAGTVNTGSDMQDEQNGSAKSTAHCADLGATSWIATSGMAGVSFAQSDYLDTHNQEIAQEIDSFDTSAHAARALSQLQAFMRKCATYKDSTSGITYHLATSTVSGLGSSAVQGAITSSRIQGGIVEIASLNGDNVVTALYSATSLTKAKSVKQLVAQIDANVAG